MSGAGEKHITRIFEKLGAANRTQVTARARGLGLLADPAEPPATTRRWFLHPGSGWNSTAASTFG
jgi:hypothetical protein